MITIHAKYLWHRHRLTPNIVPITMRIFAIWLILGPLGCLSQTTLSIPSVNSQQVSSAQSPRIFNIPSSPSPLNLSIALCSGTHSPRFFISNGTTTNDPGIENAGDEIFLYGGLLNWQGTGPTTLFAYSGGIGSQSFQVGLTTDSEQRNAIDWGSMDIQTYSCIAPIFQNTSIPPLLGDTTATQALIFSPPFQDAPIENPTYPNYTLLPANVSTIASPPTAPPQTLLVFQTSNISSLLLQFNHSACGITHVPGNVVSFGNPLTTTTVLRDVDGWRTQWVLEGLTPSTNYTAYVVENARVVNGPLYFLTKSGSS
jgi:calcium channel MID1